jgi:hypothetical protein
VKRVCANDSAGSRVKVGHRQAINSENPPQAIEGDFFWPEFGHVLRFDVRTAVPCTCS